ncbi:S26 family signal peptidase [Virgisporangium aurantiacum]|uniref:S26 family signal peptidase n=1 Tax=Virgisporangium aurantiacum TaxID=175570 RepID=UPI001EF2FB1A|nr:S26 family signal peptidase [Virgisporangium aurantiacum]
MNWVVIGIVGLGAVALAVLVRKALIVVTVDGYSMSPTLAPGDRVLALRRTFGGRPRRNAIVVTRPPDRMPGQLLIKRVVALAGDADPRGEGVIPAGSLFIVGDSKYSSDSRTFGPVQQDLVLGVVVRRMSSG